MRTRRECVPWMLRRRWRNWPSSSDRQVERRTPSHSNPKRKLFALLSKTPFPHRVCGEKNLLGAQSHETVAGTDVNRTVGTLLDFSYAPVTIRQEFFFRDDFVSVKDQSYEMASRHRADEQVSFPGGKQISRIEHHSRRRDGRHPIVARFLDTFH